MVHSFPVVDGIRTNLTRGERRASGALLPLLPGTRPRVDWSFCSQAHPAPTPISSRSVHCRASPATMPMQCHRVRQRPTFLSLSEPTSFLKSFIGGGEHKRRNKDRASPGP